MEYEVDPLIICAIIIDSERSEAIGFTMMYFFSVCGNFSTRHPAQIFKCITFSEKNIKPNWCTGEAIFFFFLNNWEKTYEKR